MDRRIATLIALMTLAITQTAVAQIYKCEGPNGPIYSDKECGSNSSSIELQESSGLSGVSEQDKAFLAEKKQERKLEREQARERTQSQNQQSTIINNQTNTYSQEIPEYWVRDQDRLRNRDNINIRPDKPLPITLPAKQRPATQRKKR